MPDIKIPDGLAFRVLEASDESFIFSSFIKATASRGMLLDRQMQKRHAHECLEHILRAVLRKATCLILCDQNYLDSICGYVIFERQQRQVCLHNLYVKEGFRGLGYSWLLYNFATRNLHLNDTVLFSNLTPRWRNIADKHKLPYHYRPSLLFASNTFASHEDTKEHHAKEV